MVPEPKGTTLEEFLALPGNGNLHEYVRGAIREMPPPKGLHGALESAILSLIDRYLQAKARDLGWNPEQGLAARHSLVGFVAGGEFGMQFQLRDDPRQIRSADGEFIPAEQLEDAAWDGETYFPQVAALVIEIISTFESAIDVNEKVQDYLSGGAHRVWCVYALRSTVHIHDAQSPTRVLRRSDTLTDALLPGFALPLWHLFLAAE